MKQDNMMRNIVLEKITLNIGTGGPGDKLDKAMKLLAKITGTKPVVRKTKKRIPTWGVRPGLEVGCMATLRRKKAHETLKRLFAALDNSVPQAKFDRTGNLSFGIKEYLNIPAVEYDSSIGIIGLEVAVTLMRKGYRVKRRLLRSAKIPQRHRITKENAIEFIRKTYKVEVT